MKISIALFFLIFASVSEAAESRTHLYKSEDMEFEGFIAYPETEEKAPGILIVHQWMGVTDYEKMRAKMLAELGYVALVVDVYGKGVRAKNVEQASSLATQYRSDRNLLRERVQLGLAELKRDPRVDPTKIAAIGYCFGGGAVLELARSGADLNAVLSFHGNLDTPNLEDALKIKAKVLVFHGAADPYVPPEQVEAFRKEMESAKVDWYMISYGQAVHSFTHKDAGDDPSKGAAYKAEADRHSWNEVQSFFKSIF